jgi:hypothetical protein
MVFRANNLPANNLSCEEAWMPRKQMRHFILAVVDEGQRKGNCKELLRRKNMGAACGRALLVFGVLVFRVLVPTAAAAGSKVGPKFGSKAGPSAVQRRGRWACA